MSTAVSAAPPAAEQNKSGMEPSPELEGAAEAVAPSLLERCHENLLATRDAAQKLGLSAALWVLYVPHYLMLWILGPRLGMSWVRVAAHVHWLLTFVGAQRSARQALRSMHPYFHPKMSVSEILRRHLLLKHECFARVRVYSLHASKNEEVAFKWRCHPECIAAIPDHERERGMIVVGYHFNFFQSFAAGLADFFPGVDLVQLRYRSWRCVEQAASPIARLAMKKAMEADRRAGATVFYIDDMEALVQLYRLLREAGVVAVTADGGAAGEFVDVPFFDGTFRAPSGWAKLAAATKSDVLLVCDRDVDGATRNGMFFDHVSCRDLSNETAHAAVAASIGVLERMIREEPWGWHPWQRLRVEVGADGVRRYSLKQYGFNEGKRLNGRASTPSKPQVASLAPEVGAKAEPVRPRVAVVANSYPPYRVHLHRQIVEQAPEIELWSISTHSNSYSRWDGLRPPEEIRPVDFSGGEPTNEQTQVRHSLREWRKGGQIIRWLKEHNVSAVFVQGCGDLGRIRIIRWCRRRRVPCFLTGDFNIRSDVHRPLKRWLKRRVYNRGVGWSYGLMPCGEHGLALLHRYGGEDKPEWRFPFIPDITLFERTPSASIERLRTRFDLEPHRRRLVYSARMMPAKRPDLALDAFLSIAAERPDWDLVMIGEGSLRAELSARVPEEVRKRITWTGFLADPADVAGIYAQCDVLVLPSDHEPWGVVIVEAAAAGLAIVASDKVGAAPELVHHHDNGAVFRSGDLNALKRALRELTADGVVDRRKARSPHVLRDWLAMSAPVDGFRAALAHCGVIKDLAQGPRNAADHAGSSQGDAARWQAPAAEATRTQNPNVSESQKVPA